MMIDLRAVETDADLEAWAALKTRIVPDEPVTAEQLRRTEKATRLLLLAELDGVLAGCGIGVPSSFPGRAFVAPRVVPELRSRGVGTALLDELLAHARSLDLTGLTTFVDGRDERSRAFAERCGLVEVDRQLEQVRLIGDEQPPHVSDGVELEPLSGRREELLREAYELALQAYADMPLPEPVEVPLDEWLLEEATLPEGSYVARADGTLVGFAGLMERPQPGTAEHGLTVVRRGWRGRGIATALKRAELHWAATNGFRELVTWTQRGNEAMQALNRRLGYVDRTVVLTMQGPLSGVDSTEPPAGVGSTEPAGGAEAAALPAPEREQSEVPAPPAPERG